MHAARWTGGCQLPTLLLQLLHLGLAQALDEGQLLLGRVGQGLDGVDATIQQLLDVCCWDAMGLNATRMVKLSTQGLCRGQGPAHTDLKHGDAHWAGLVVCHGCVLLPCHSRIILCGLHVDCRDCSAGLPVAAMCCVMLPTAQHNRKRRRLL